MANLFCCSYLSVWERGNTLWFVGIRRCSDVADGWLNHNKWCNSITRAFKRAKTRLFFLLQVPWMRLCRAPGAELRPDKDPFRWLSVVTCELQTALLHCQSSLNFIYLFSQDFFFFNRRKHLRKKKYKYVSASDERCHIHFCQLDELKTQTYKIFSESNRRQRRGCLYLK